MEILNVTDCINSLINLSDKNSQREIELLCLGSDYLVRFSRRYPALFRDALKEYTKGYEKSSLEERLLRWLPEDPALTEGQIMRQLRLFKRTEMLKITLRFLTGISDIVNSMNELSLLAEVILERALQEALRLCSKRYGDARGGISIIALGKLGAQELNYSSDVDIVGFYEGNPLEETTGVIGPTGVRTGRVSLHEYYSKAMETLTRLLTTETEEAVLYRADLRLRPQGQKSPLAQTLTSAVQYYFTWGRVWERMVLIRARPVAGDRDIGQKFIEGISPFLWEQRIDYSGIEEIRQMKKKIDATFTKDDIKRGYGGIREIEFFIQTLQLIYAPEVPSLRTHRTLQALNALKRATILKEEETSVLEEAYLYLRRIEHFIQMKEDLQTHKLPKSHEAMKKLSLLMGYGSENQFLSDLKIKRLQVKKMYNDLLGTEEERHAEALALLTEDFSDEELQTYLSFRGAKDPERSAKSLISIKQALYAPELQPNRSLLKESIPICVEEAMMTEAVDEGLSFLEEILKKGPESIAFFQWFKDEPLFRKGLIRITAISSYMRRLLSGHPLYISYLIEDPSMRKTRQSLRENLSRMINHTGFKPEAFVRFRQLEQLRAGIFYAAGVFSEVYLYKTLTKIAEVAIEEATKRIYSEDPPVVVAMGKLGTRELDFQSDIDILIIDEKLRHRKAEELLKLLTEYTSQGPAFKVDMRLRPDGSKGPLVHSLESYRQYYLKRAANWEIQALLKARPITGRPSYRQAFIMMLKDVLGIRGSELNWHEIQQMRQRIIKEVSKESQGIDLKFGPGGLEDVEFFVQYLMLANNQISLSASIPRALKQLIKKDIIKSSSGQELLEIYTFLRKVYTLMCLNEEFILKDRGDKTEMYARVVGKDNAMALIETVKSLREKAMEIIEESVR